MTPEVFTHFPFQWEVSLLVGYDTATLHSRDEKVSRRAISDIFDRLTLPIFK